MSLVPSSLPRVYDLLHRKGVVGTEATYTCTHPLLSPFTSLLPCGLWVRYKSATFCVPLLLLTSITDVSVGYKPHVKKRDCEKKCSEGILDAGFIFKIKLAYSNEGASVFLCGKWSSFYYRYYFSRQLFCVDARNFCG